MDYTQKSDTEQARRTGGQMMLEHLIDKYTALVEEEPTEYWDAADWAYHYAYVEILKDLTNELT